MTILFIFKNKIKYIVYILILLIVLAYVVNISSIPDSLILFQNEELNLKPILGVKIEETVQVGANINTNISNIQNKVKNKEYNLSLLGFKLKTIKTNIITNTKVIPLGNIVGLKLYTKGIVVVGVSEIKGEDNKIYKPYEEAGIELGDSIIEINGETVKTTEELILCVSKSKGQNIEIKYINDGETLNTIIKPVKTSENTYKIGLWVRDAAAGVGTITFYDKETNSFAALGHGIQDVDTGELVDISSGEFVTSDIIDIQKGEKDNPGKIEGTIEDSKLIGKIYSNTDFGVYGITTDKSEFNIENLQEVEVASRNEIKTGRATILCTLEDGVTKEYEVQIEKIYINNNENNKSMLIKVTDEELLDKTGGIIQGMSGSPIIQEGRLIGALTHVLVQNPDTGYAVFADLMIKQIRIDK